MTQGLPFRWVGGSRARIIGLARKRSRRLPRSCYLEGTGHVSARLTISLPAPVWDVSATGIVRSDTSAAVPTGHWIAAAAIIALEVYLLFTASP